MSWKMHVVLRVGLQDSVLRKFGVRAANGRFSAVLRVVLPLHCHHPRLGFPFLRHSLLAFLRSLIDASSLVCDIRLLLACALQFERVVRDVFSSPASQRNRVRHSDGHILPRKQAANACR